MKAYILCNSPLGSDYSGEGEYYLATEEKTIYSRWCSNRGFANGDLTRSVEHMLKENGITAVYSNGMLVWVDGVMTSDAETLFRIANYEYERLNSDAL